MKDLPTDFIACLGGELQPALVIRFINTNKLVDELIDWETNSLFCHTEALSRDHLHWVGAHAVTGVQARPLNWCKTLTREYTYAIPVAAAQYEASMSWLESKVGLPYDYADIMGLAVHAKFGDSKHAVICSALMTEYIMQAGIMPLNCKEGFTYLITPETLHLSPVFIGRRISNVSRRTV